MLLKEDDQDSANEKRTRYSNTQAIHSHVDKSVVYSIGDKWIYDRREQIVYGGRANKVKLRDKTASVLNLLIEGEHQIIASGTFFDQVWSGRFVSENVLKQSVRELRSCFEDASKTLIKTTARKGYSLHAEITVEPRDSHLSKYIVDSALAKLEGDMVCRADVEISASTGKLCNTTGDNSPCSNIDKDESTHEFKPACEHNNSKDIPLLKRHYFLYNRALIFSTLVLLATTIYVLYKFMGVQTALSVSEMKIDEMRSSKNFYQDILLRYHNSPQQTSTTFKTILKKSIGQVDAYSGSDTEKMGMLYGLFELYNIAGLYEESRVIVGRIEKLIISLYGIRSKEYYQLRFNTIDILIKINNRQEAYNLSQITLDQVRRFHEDDLFLLARAYFFSGKSNLFCVAPFCERTKSLAAGEEHTRIALSLLKGGKKNYDTDVADILWQLNWFLWEGDEKIRVSEKALHLYREIHGEIHEKTAAGMEQLGRTLIFWNRDWERGEDLLLKAYSIRQKLYPKIHPEMARIHGYLGEHFFMVGDFPLSIEHLSKAIDINTSSLGEGNDRNLENMMLIARSELYSGNKDKANQWINRIFGIIKRHKLTPSDIIYDAVLVTKLRVNLEDETVTSMLDISRAMEDVEGKFKSPKYVLLHEYQSQILKNFSEHIDNEYFEIIEYIVNDFNPKNRYLYHTDIDYLKKRATVFCQNYSDTFCSRVASLFDKFPLR